MTDRKFGAQLFTLFFGPLLLIAIVWVARSEPVVASFDSSSEVVRELKTIRTAIDDLTTAVEGLKGKEKTDGGSTGR